MTVAGETFDTAARLVDAEAAEESQFDDLTHAVVDVR